MIAIWYDDDSDDDDELCNSFVNHNEEVQLLHGLPVSRSG